MGLILFGSRPWLAPLYPLPPRVVSGSDRRDVIRNSVTLSPGLSPLKLSSPPPVFRPPFRVGRTIGTYSVRENDSCIARECACTLQFAAVALLLASSFHGNHSHNLSTARNSRDEQQRGRNRSGERFLSSADVDLIDRK